MAEIEGIDVSIQIITDTQRLINLTAALTGVRNQLGVVFDSATQAQRALGGLVTQSQRVTGHVQALGAASVESGKGMAAAAGRIDRFVASLGPAEKAAINYSRALRDIRDAAARGIISDEQARQFNNLARAQRDAALAAARQKEETIAAAKQQKIAAQQAREAAQMQREHERATQANAAAVQRLRQQLLPTTAAIKSSQQQMAELRRLRGLGLIDAAEAGRMRRVLLGNARGMRRLGVEGSKLTRVFRNLESASVITLGPLSRLGAIVRSTGVIISRSGVLIGALTLTLVGLGLAVGFAIKGMINARREMDRMHGALTAASGSAVLAEEEFGFLLETSNRLGISVAKAVPEFAKFEASALRAGLSVAEARDVFVGASEAAAALRLSVQQQEGVFRALQQMMSKGRVQAEEFVQQLGEQLPGAVTLGARALSKVRGELVTTSELLTEIQKKRVDPSTFLPALGRELSAAFGRVAQQQANTIDAISARIGNRWDAILRNLDEILGISELWRQELIGIEIILRNIEDLTGPGNVVGKGFEELIASTRQFIEQGRVMGFVAEEAATAHKKLLDARIKLLKEGGLSEDDLQIRTLRLLIDQVNALSTQGPPNLLMFEQLSSDVDEMVLGLKIARRQIEAFGRGASLGDLLGISDFEKATKDIKDATEDDLKLLLESFDKMEIMPELLRRAGGERSFPALAQALAGFLREADEQAKKLIQRLRRTPDFREDIARDLAILRGERAVLATDPASQAEARRQQERVQQWEKLNRAIKKTAIGQEEALQILSAFDEELAGLQIDRLSSDFRFALRDANVELEQTKSILDAIGEGDSFAKATADVEIAVEAFKALSDLELTVLEGRTRISFQQVLSSIQTGVFALSGELSEAEKQALDLLDVFINLSRVSRELQFEDIEFDLDLQERSLKRQKELIFASNKERTIGQAVLEKENELLAAGLDLEDARSVAILNRVAALTKEQLAIKRMTEFADEFSQVFSSGLRDLLVDFKNINEVIASMEKKLLDLFFNLLIAEPLEDLIRGSLKPSPGGGDMLTSIFGSLFGFQHGGSFTIPGATGSDKVVPIFRASPGETVTVTPRGQQTSGSPQFFFGDINVGGSMSREESRMTARQLMDDIMDEGRMVVFRRG